MATELQKKKFLTKLEALSNGHPINSKGLRDAISWKAETYDRVRKDLLVEGLIKAAVGGPGGTVQMENIPRQGALSVFISYCHDDEDMKDKLVKHLAPLKRSGLISEWHDRKITAGENWGHTISSNLETASIVLLLVSIDFINSEYCDDFEMDAALKRHDAKQCLVIPVIVRNCLWQMTPFAKLQALPKDAKAVSAWPDYDNAFVDIVQGIKIAADKMAADK